MKCKKRRSDRSAPLQHVRILQEIPCKVNSQYLTIFFKKPIIKKLFLLTEKFSGLLYKSRNIK